MADCIDISTLSAQAIKILKVKDLTEENIAISGEEQAKRPYKFDTHHITPDIYYDLFFGTKSNKEDAFTRMKEVVNNNNAIKKLFGATNNVSTKNPLFADLFNPNATYEEKLENGQRMQIRGLVMKHVIGTIKSDRDVQNNLNISEEEAKNLLYDKDGSRNVATIGMATALGRDIAYTVGFKVSMDPELSNRFYNQIGMNALTEVAEKTDILSMETGGSIINNNFMDDKYSEHKKSQKIIPGHNIVRINYDKILKDSSKKMNDKDKEELKYTQIKAINDAFESGRSVELMSNDESFMKTAGLIDGSARYINRMSVPSNLAVATEEAQKSSFGKGIKMSPEMNTLLNNMQHIPGEVNPRVGQFFLFLNQAVEEAKQNQLVNKVDYDFESIIKKIAGDDAEMLHFAFGTFDTTASVDAKAKAVGQSLSKTSTVQNIIEDAKRYFNEDGSAKPIFFEHEMYRTGRVGYIQGILNPQTDKFFSRFVLDGGEYTVETGTKAHIQLINGIKDDSGIRVEEIMGDDLSNEGLEYLIKEYDKTYRNNLVGKEAFDAQNKFHKILNNGKSWMEGKHYTLPKLNGSLWQKLSSLEAISDVRKGTNNKITTRFQTKPDATGSGIVLQLLQMIGLAGSHDGAIRNLSKLGLINGEKGNIIDVYGFLEEAIKLSMKELVVPGKNGELDYSQVSKLDMKNNDYSNEVKSNIFIQSMIDFGISKNLRDIAKPATMITSYLAGKETVKAETGEAYTQAIFDVLESRTASKKQLEFIFSILEDADQELADQVKANSYRHKVTANTIMNTPGVKSALEQHISSTVGEHMYTLIGESLTTGAMKNFQNKIMDVYGSMVKISERQDELISEGKADKSTAFQLRTLPVQIVMDKLEFPDSKSWKNKDGSPMSDKKLLDTYGMMITSPVQVMEKVNGKDTLVMKEGMNALTSLVNVIHSMDSAIMFRAHRKTREKLGLPADEQSFNMSIHDANNGNANYNAVFQDMYREALIEVVGSYDMFSQMVSAYETMVESKHPDNTEGMGDKDFKKMKEDAEKGLNTKQQMIADESLDLKSDKTFGFKDDYDYFKKKVTTKKTESTQEPTAKDTDYEISEDEQYIWAKGNPFPWKIDAPLKKNIMDFKVPTKDGSKITFKEHMKQSYENVNALLESNKTWYIYDTETTDKNNPEMIQLGIQEMNGNKKIGKVEEFFFTADKINPAATKVHGYSVGSLQKKFDEQGLKDNAAVLVKIEQMTGSDHMVAYNAKFDAEAVNNTINKTEGSTTVLNVDPQYDALGATMKIAQDQGVKLRRSSNTLKDAAERTGIKWDDNLAHDAKYDVDQTADIVINAYSDLANSMRQRSDGSLVYSPDNKGEKFTKRKESLDTVLKRISKISPTVKSFMKRHSTDKFKWDEEKSFYQPSNHTISLVNNAALNDIQIKRIFEHEIFHHDTVAYLYSHTKDPDVKFLTEMTKRIVKDAKEIAPKLKGKRTKELFTHMTKQDTDIKNLAELTAIFKTEPEALKPILNAMGYPTTESRLRRLIRKVKEWFSGTTSMKSPYTADEVMESIYAIEIAGKNFDNSSASNKARQEYVEEAGDETKSESPDNNLPHESKERKAFMKKMEYKPYEPVDAYKDKIPYIEDALPKLNKMTSSLIGAVILDEKHVFKGQKQLEAADEYLTEHFPIYASNREALLNYTEHNPFIQEMKGFLNPNRFGKRIDMERMITAADSARQKRGSIDNALIANMKRMMNKMTPAQVNTIYNVTSQAPMFNLAEDGLMNSLVNGDKDLETEIARLDGLLGKDKHRTQRMADMLSGKDDHVLSVYDGYNTDTSVSGDKTRKIFEQSVALKTIRNTENYQEGFDLLKENKELYALIMDASLGLKDKSDLLYQVKHSNRKGNESFTDAKRYRENLVLDVFEDQYDIEAITTQEFSEGQYSTDNGWMMLRKPKGKEYGIMYRKSKDETFQSGVGTDLSYRHNDVIVPKSKQIPNAINVLSTDVGKDDKRHKMVLTAKEKKKLGLVRNPADAIYRSYSRLLEIEETQQVRDLLLTQEFTMKAKTENDLAKFDEDLGKMKPEDRKWLVALPKGVRKSDIVNKDEDGNYKYPNIQKYYKVPDRASSVGNFRHNFDLVRIDAAPWLAGYKDAILFENTPGARETAYAVRQMVKWTKITWTALSPVKIMNDAISNTLVLAGYDVPPKKIVKYGTEINKQIGEFEKLRMKELNAIVHGKKAEAKRLAKEIKNHPMSILQNNGLMQSINIELFQRDQSVVTGLQKDIEALLNKHILLPKGEKSSVFKGIEYLQEHGDFGIESILQFASKGAKEIEQLKALGEQMESSRKKIKGFRESNNDEAMAKYLSEFLMTPESEAVQLGSTLVQRADIVARGILVKHMMDEGKTEEEAIIAATDAFINYKQNMPKQLKILSDYGVLLFPSFWMRIQRVIWSLLKRNPATAMAALSMEEMIQMNIATVFDANLVAKWENGMFGLPPVMGFWE